MLEVGKRMRNQPAPPHVIFEALTQPDRDAAGRGALTVIGVPGSLPLATLPRLAWRT